MWTVSSRDVHLAVQTPIPPFERSKHPRTHIEPKHMIFDVTVHRNCALGPHGVPSCSSAGVKLLIKCVHIPADLQ